MRKDAGYLRTQRLQEISKKIAKGFSEADNNKVILRKLLSWIMFNIGLTRSKALEYVELCCEVHDWVIKDGFITVEKVEKVQA